MSDITTDIAAYNAMREKLELDHMGKWVLFRNAELVALYPSFEEAATDAVAKYGRGPYLIRQIGAQDVTLPASVMYRLSYA